MSMPAQGDCELRSTFPATLEAIEEFFVAFHSRSQAIPDPSVCFKVELLVREALTNAVVHGSHTDPGKQVRCALRLKRGRMLILVEDQGNGFDWRAVRNRPDPSRDSSGRGVGILFTYADRVRYNNKGNAVTMVKRLLKKEYQ